ncbi:poly(ADP-ribose) glycohydrolase-like [Leguminivora glycinivorella]|uniref:poly(ADP-ribose) glycohydrolase-like n=1 Tax=Leguminivora glycinivorella TaxID=1035111 RepID=UPI00200C705B|nr:poly(ADP-ribose) glycohydrolase-like [Leguminivora glycinivorella]
MTSDMESDNSWRGVPLTEIWGSQSPWGAPEFPLVAPAFNHTVLYHIPSSGCVPGDRPPKPQNGQDNWDHDFVRMPCSNQSLYPVEDSSGETHLKKRWGLIQSALWKPIRNSQELAAAILSYNTQFKNCWKFRALHKLFNEYLEEEESQYFFDVTLPEIAKLALDLPRLIQSPIPLLKQHRNRSISLSQQQISSLLANAFFSTFPRRNSTKKSSEYASFPHINFNTLYESSGSDSVLEKLKCLCHYFRRVCTKAPRGAVTFSRRSAPPRRCPAWPQSPASLAAVPLHVAASGTIEDSDGLIQLDFANKYLGGGVLGHGCVQEEIRFVICPELMVSMLFTEVLRPNEALMIIGCERYSKYTGYGSSFQWAGDHSDATPLDSSLRRRVSVLAVDALPYAGAAQQYRPPAVLRELNKAWVGFTFYSEEPPTSTQYPGVATGNWGCGAFGGTPQLKTLIQLMVCAEARRPMAYYTFNDAAIRDEFVNIYNLLARYNVTVGQLYQLIARFCTTDVRKNNLHAFIQNALKNGQLPTCSPDTGPEQTRLDAGSALSETRLATPVTRQAEEKMDISDALDVNEIELSESLQKELLKQSPDMFQDDTDSQETQSNSEVSKSTTEGNKMASSSHKMAASNSKSLTTDLFEEMNKLDQSNGKLNLSTTHTNILDDSKNVNDDMDPSEKSEQIKLDPSSELKKKMAKKITDYFSKKSI